jgi:DHA1 family multidrug resistance protein-like MFS transporter
MPGLMRDTAFGQIVRVVSGRRYFKYPEEENPELWKKFIDKEKSANLAHHGTVDPPEDDEKSNADSDRRPREDSDSSSRTHVGGGETINEVSGAKVDPENGKDINLVSWYGPDDPEMPMNWSSGKKAFVTAEICLLTTSVYIGSSIYSAGTQSVMAIFGVSQVAATLGLCLFVAGYGIGPMIFSPMSEIPQIGRNPVYLVTLFLFVVFQVPTALAQNFGMLLAFRFITGFFGSPVLATGGASLGDMYKPSKRAYAMSIWGISAICGPTLGPLVGGFAVLSAPLGGGFTAPWTWPIWELMWLSAFCLVFLIFFLPETSANNILVRRTKRLREITGNDKLICEPELMAQEMTPRAIVMMSLVRPFTLNFTEPMVFFLNLYIALVYGILYIWFESFVIVFVEMYHFSVGTEGLAYLGILVGALITIPPYFYYLHKYLEPQFNENGELQPEKRLYACTVGAFCIPICLFWFGWSSRPDIHWIMPIIGSSFFAIGTFLLFNSILNYLPDAYPEYAASVLAGNDFMRSAFGAGFPLFATAMYKDLGVGWASSTLAFISIAFIPIPFVLIKVRFASHLTSSSWNTTLTSHSQYGPTLRRNYSKHARKDL